MTQAQGKSIKTSLKCSGAITQVCLKEIRNIPLTFSLLDLELLKPLVSLEDSVLSTKHARANTKAIRVTVKSRRNPKTFSRFRPQLLAMLTEAGANNWLILAQWHIACYSLRDKEETRQNPVSPDGFYVGLRSVLTNDIPARQFVASHHSTAKLDLFQLQLEVPLISVRGMHSLFEVKNFLRHSEKRKELNANFLCSHFSRNLPPWSFFFRFTVILRVLNSCTRSLSASSCDKHRRGGCANLFPQINDSGKEHHGNAKN